MIAGKGLEQACRESDVICSGVNTFDGKLTNANVAAAHPGYEYTDIHSLI